MGISARGALTFYLLVIFASLPFLPAVVAFVSVRLGENSVTTPIHAVLLLVAFLPAVRLCRPPRPASPWPYISYVFLLLSGLLTVLILASSPVGRIHLAEYGLLGILVMRALPSPPTVGRHFQALAAAAFIGLIDECVQYWLPTRVFDWYDVGLNSAAAGLGVLMLAWWRWTSGPGR